ncbi:hypothetical protein ILT44_29930 [Microvirga sp. BT689]|uniref:hypothetical protein n=1 Tax=Microvirga arvi TaxID=2778731 RepID=UPI001951264B|nr:hypothetical protein [Microvirga arvi]MBM6584417.1 hypothetical protein [Microvirga arvi]
MTLTQMPFLVRHLIPDHDICTKIGRLMHILVDGDEDPMDINLTDLAVQFFVRDLIHDALRMGLSICEPSWSLAPNGDVEVIFPFEREADAAMFKLSLPQ